MAIDRKTFDRCFVPNTSIRPPPPSLIYDRMFAFYDTNGDNLIGFEEFLKGLASLNNNSNDERLRRVFRGYDIDGDGYVERKDFLRVFRAYYALSRELTRDMVAGMEDDFLEGGARDVVLGSQPVSSAFPGSIPSGERSRTGEGKRMNSEGDMEIIDNEGILRQDGDDTGDRHSVVGDAAVRAQFSRMRPLFPSTLRLAPSENLDPIEHAAMEREQNDDEEDEDGASESGSDQSSSSVASGTWPPAEHILEEDIIEALGAYIPAREITDPIDRARVADAVYHRMREDDQRRVFDARQRGIDERWRRRAFYTDEEDGATVPPGYERDPAIDDSSDEDLDESESRPPSFRSRSSSKVRFQDDLNDDEYDIRSNPSTSSRSIPVGERWGGFEIPEVERDVGKEILYQVTQQGFNELLDILFKPKEDLMMEVHRTRADRKVWAREIELAAKEDPSKRTSAENPPAEEELEEIINEQPLDDLLQRAGYGIQSPVLAPANTGPVLSPSSPEATASDDGDEDEYEDNDDDVRPTHLADPGEDTGFGQERPFEESDTASATSSDYDNVSHASGVGPSSPIVEDDTLYYDPTLPHHRPDEPSVVAPEVIDESDSDLEESPTTNTTPGLPDQFRLQPGTTSLPAPYSPRSSPEAGSTAPKLPPSPMQPLPPPHRVDDQPREAPAPRQPSPRTLARWVYLDQVERENKERGNGARLNFEEFSRRMAADRGRRLAFVASWIEMASF
jgi:hypothetical protein